MIEMLKPVMLGLLIATVVMLVVVEFLRYQVEVKRWNYDVCVQRATSYGSDQTDWAVRLDRCARGE